MLENKIFFWIWRGSYSFRHEGSHVIVIIVVENWRMRASSLNQSSWILSLLWLRNLKLFSNKNSYLGVFWLKISQKESKILLKLSKLRNSISKRIKWHQINEWKVDWIHPLISQEKLREKKTAQGIQVLNLKITKSPKPFHNTSIYQKAMSHQD